MADPLLAGLPTYLDPTTARIANRVFAGLACYHRHRIEGLEHLPIRGPALLVVNHSLATYDIGLLGWALYRRLGRAPRALADRLIFSTPPLAHVASKLGAIEGRPDTALHLLQGGALVMVAPGGMREALRPSSAKYTLSWNNRRGFARLAIAAQCPVVCAACPAADDLYTVYASPITDFCLRRLHLPAPVLRGFGPTLMPRPVRLVHYLSPVVMPPLPPDPADMETVVAAFATTLAHTMQRLLQT